MDSSWRNVSLSRQAELRAHPHPIRAIQLYWRRALVAIRRRWAWRFRHLGVLEEAL
jgi:hypothetical protein